LRGRWDEGALERELMADVIKERDRLTRLSRRPWKLREWFE
jgi:hypothetical protein